MAFNRHTALLASASILAAGLFFLGVLALVTLPLAIPLAGAFLIALGIMLIIIGAIAILT
jgi:hypothetical protein